MGSITKPPTRSKKTKRLGCQGYRHVPKLREALPRNLKIKTGAPKMVA